MGAILIDPVTAIAAVSWKAIAALIFVVALPIIFCHWAFFMVVQIFPANVAALSTLSVPVIGVFSSALILEEPVTATELVALFSGRTIPGTHQSGRPADRKLLSSK